MSVLEIVTVFVCIVVLGSALIQLVVLRRREAKVERREWFTAISSALGAVFVISYVVLEPLVSSATLLVVLIALAVPTLVCVQLGWPRR